MEKERAPDGRKLPDEDNVEPADVLEEAGGEDTPPHREGETDLPVIIADEGQEVCDGCEALPLAEAIEEEGEGFDGVECAELLEEGGESDEIVEEVEHVLVGEAVSLEGDSSEEAPEPSGGTDILEAAGLADPLELAEFSGSAELAESLEMADLADPLEFAELGGATGGEGFEALADEAEVLGDEAEVLPDEAEALGPEVVGEVCLDDGEDAGRPIGSLEIAAEAASGAELAYEEDVDRAFTDFDPEVAEVADLAIEDERPVDMDDSSEPASVAEGHETPVEADVQAETIGDGVEPSELVLEIRTEEEPLIGVAQGELAGGPEEAGADTGESVGFSMCDQVAVPDQPFDGEREGSIRVEEITAEIEEDVLFDEDAAGGSDRLEGEQLEQEPDSADLGRTRAHLGSKGWARARTWLWVGSGAVAAAVLASIVSWPHLIGFLSERGWVSAAPPGPAWNGIDHGTVPEQASGIDRGEEEVATFGQGGAAEATAGGRAAKGGQGDPKPHATDPAVERCRLAWGNVVRLAIGGTRTEIGREQ